MATGSMTPEGIMNTPDLSKLDPKWDVIESSVRPVTEGVWHARRSSHVSLGGFGSIDHSLFFTDDVEKAVSLAEGDGLHGWGGIDHENYVFRAPEGFDRTDDVCCHGSYEAAERCAITFFATGQWCRGDYEDED